MKNKNILLIFFAILLTGCISVVNADIAQIPNTTVEKRSLNANLLFSDIHNNAHNYEGIYDLLIEPDEDYGYGKNRILVQSEWFTIEYREAYNNYGPFSVTITKANDKILLGDLIGKNLNYLLKNLIEDPEYITINGNIKRVYYPNYYHLHFVLEDNIVILVFYSHSI